MKNQARHPRVRKKVVLIVVSSVLGALLLAFGIWNLLWFRYIDNVFTPIISDERLVNPALSYPMMFKHNFTYYTYYDEESGYRVDVVVPPYLRFYVRDGVSHIIDDLYISIPLPAYIQPGDLTGSFGVRHTGAVGRINQSFVLTLSEFYDINDPTAIIGFGSLALAVDRNGKPQERSPDVDEAYYEKWLEIYHRHYDKIMDMISYFWEFFGEDIIR